MIARVDDLMQLKMEKLRKSNAFLLSIQARLNWLKNMGEERDAPWQLMMHSMNMDYCVYCSLSLWLKVFISKYPHALLIPFIFGFSQDITEKRGVNALKTICQDIFRGQI